MKSILALSFCLATAKPFAALTVRVEGRKVAVTASDTGVMIPIEVKGFGKKPFYGVVRDGVWEHEFKDAATGKVVVTNLADGVNDTRAVRIDL